jgi:hypothetical protein
MPNFLRNAILSATIPSAILSMFYREYRDALVFLGIALFFGLLLTAGVRRAVSTALVSVARRARPIAVDFGRWLRRLGVEGGAAVGRGAVRGGRAWVGNVISHPLAWMAIISTVTASFLFWNGKPHLGVVAILTALAFSIACFDGWWVAMLRTVTRRPAWTWVIASIISIMVTIGHAWFLGKNLWWWVAIVASIVSLLLAVITAAGHGRWLWRKTGGAALECLCGIRGVGPLLLSWAAIAGMWALVLVVKGVGSKLIYLTYSIFIIFGFLGFGWMMILSGRKSRK